MIGGIGNLKDSLTESLTESFDVESLIRPIKDRTSSLTSSQEEEESLFPTLTWKQRFIGCISCMTIGYLLSFGSFFRFGALLTGNPLPFVLYSTTGNIISLSGSCFLSGPSSQIKRMFHKTRRIASIAYISSLILTLIIAFTCYNVKGIGVVLLLLLLCQYVSIAWYCLSYIPFAREGVKKCFWKVYNEMMEE